MDLRQSYQGKEYRAPSWVTGCIPSCRCSSPPLRSGSWACQRWPCLSDWSTRGTKNGRRNECILRTSKLNKGTVWNSTTSKTHLALMGHGFPLCSASIINIKLMLCKAFTAYLCVTHNMLVLWLLKWRLFCDTMIQQKISTVFKPKSFKIRQNCTRIC